jgi:hypothetical protein
MAFHSKYYSEPFLISKKPYRFPDLALLMHKLHHEWNTHLCRQHSMASEVGGSDLTQIDLDVQSSITRIARILTYLKLI